MLSISFLEFSGKVRKRVRNTAAVENAIRMAQTGWLVVGYFYWSSLVLKMSNQYSGGLISEKHIARVGYQTFLPLSDGMFLFHLGSVLI